MSDKELIGFIRDIEKESAITTGAEVDGRPLPYRVFSLRETTKEERERQADLLREAVEASIQAHQSTGNPNEWDGSMLKVCRAWQAYKESL